MAQKVPSLFARIFEKAALDLFLLDPQMHPFFLILF